MRLIDAEGSPFRIHDYAIPTMPDDFCSKGDRRDSDDTIPKKDLGKIQEIKEVFDVNVKGDHETYDGYIVKTDNHTILVLISNFQDCCESWGYFSTPDDCKKFIGAKLIDVVLTDTELNQQRCVEIIGDTFLTNGSWRDNLDAGGIQFVDFKTDRGVYQLAVYNAHNGYYGHDIKVIIDESESYSDCI